TQPGHLSTYCDRSVSQALTQDLIDHPSNYLVKWHSPSGALLTSSLTLRAGGSTAPPARGLKPSPSTLDPSGVATVPISAFPEGIAAGEGGVWVVAGTGDGTGRADIVRLDPRTGKVVAKIPDVPIPSWEFGGAGIATGAGGVWVVGDPNSG